MDQSLLDWEMLYVSYYLMTLEIFSWWYWLVLGGLLASLVFVQVLIWYKEKRQTNGPELDKIEKTNQVGCVEETINQPLL